MKKIITGIQPSGSITIGNYIGSIKQMVKMQDNYESYIFIADLHSITVSQDPKTLKNKIRELLALYIACGIDPEKNIIFLQSENEYHTNLSWLLECTTPYGELSRMTQFKDKSQKNISFSAGLLTYPVLMAADILIYDIDIVPVGVDQKQHVELARNIAEKFNSKFGEVFKVPDVVMAKTGGKILDLVNPEKKMSKSSDNPKSFITLLDDLEAVRKKIMSATTDSDCEVRFDMDNKPGISNLLTVASSISEDSIESIEDKFIGKNYGEFKKYVADLVVGDLSVIQNKYNDLINSDKLDEILDKGINKTREIAKNKYLEAKKAMGLWR